MTHILISGQARKSLWIETLKLTCGDTLNRGQARKSLWIETTAGIEVGYIWPGQARKSLWIETQLYNEQISALKGSGS